MQFPLSLRFVHLFFKGLFRTLREKLIDGGVLAFAIIFSVRAGYRGEQRWELVFPWVEALCAIIFWHSLHSGYLLFQEVKLECSQATSERQSPVLLPSGTPAIIPVDVNYPSFYAVRIAGMAGLLCVVSTVLGYAAWLRPAAPQATADHPSAPTILPTVNPRTDLPIVESLVQRDRRTELPEKESTRTSGEGEGRHTPKQPVIQAKLTNDDIARGEEPAGAPHEEITDDPSLAEEEKLNAMSYTQLQAYVADTIRKLKLFDKQWTYPEQQEVSSPPEDPVTGRQSPSDLKEYWRKLDQWKHNNFEVRPKKRADAFTREFPQIETLVGYLSDRWPNVKGWEGCLAGGTMPEHTPLLCSAYLQAVLDASRRQ